MSRKADNIPHPFNREAGASRIKPGPIPLKRQRRKTRETQKRADGVSEAEWRGRVTFRSGNQEDLARYTCYLAKLVRRH